jgi:hypothetical protein
MRGRSKRDDGSSILVPGFPRKHDPLFFNPLSPCSEGMADGVDHISASVLTEKSVADAEGVR